VEEVVEEEVVEEVVEEQATEEQVVAEGEVAKKETTEEVTALHSGFLSKQSQMLKSYDKRFFSLSKDGVLSYSRDDKLTDAKKIHITKDVKVVKQEGIKRGCVFDIETPGRVYRMSAENEETADAWTAAIIKYQETLPVEEEEVVVVEEKVEEKTEEKAAVEQVVEEEKPAAAN